MLLYAFYAMQTVQSCGNRQIQYKTQTSLENIPAIPQSGSISLLLSDSPTDSQHTKNMGRCSALSHEATLELYPVKAVQRKLEAQFSDCFFSSSDLNYSL